MVVECKQFADIEGEWNKLFGEGKSLSPYMDYEFQKVFRKYLWLGKKRIGSYIRYYCFFNEKENILISIAPIMFKGRRCWIAGDLCATGYLEFIYNRGITEDEFNQMFRLLMEKLKGYTFEMNKINQSSLMYCYLNRYYNDCYIAKSICVNVSLANEWEEWYNSLGKSVRQNYRTAKNRLNREEKEWRVDVIDKCKIDIGIMKELMKVYDKRSNERNGKNSLFKGITSFVRRKYNPISVNFEKNKNNFTAILYIENKVAAYLNGIYVNDETTIVIPRLAIDSTFSVYCPGLLLCAESIKYLIKETDVRNFDLSRGDEKYKYSLGGKDHYNYTFIIKNE